MKKTICVTIPVLFLFSLFFAANIYAAESKTKVFINPGHGLEDPGAVGNRLKESDIAEKIAKRLDEKLQQYCTTRVCIGGSKLSQICKEANSFGADYFISIHVNSSRIQSANGIETYYLRGGSGKAFAKDCQSALVKKLGRFDRGVKVGRFAVLRKTYAPAVLVEIGFISNPTESVLMVSEKWQEDAAEALAAAIMSQK